MNVTYLLGAGASAQKLPVVDQIKDRLIQFRTAITDVTSAIEADTVNTHKLLNWLILDLDYHASIDTFAKKLYLARDAKQLNELKAVFSSYLKR
ncbi:MAG: hypothetical protein A2176_03980 [Spirochaetes bacterium RBG_13_51_14]|nr:MAG: hypothetical protein A2176_03980 [Spirochaetes bacterium RBG_13_51_14]